MENRWRRTSPDTDSADRSSIGVIFICAAMVGDVETGTSLAEAHADVEAYDLLDTWEDPDKRTQKIKLEIVQNAKRGGSASIQQKK